MISKWVNQTWRLPWGQTRARTCKRGSTLNNGFILWLDTFFLFVFDELILTWVFSLSLFFPLYPVTVKKWSQRVGPVLLRRIQRERESSRSTMMLR